MGRQVITARRRVPDAVESKSCEQCGTRFARKPGITGKAWAKKRFCSKSCVWEFQRKPDPRPQVICECHRPGCGRTFWSFGDQAYCRAKACQEARLREHMDDAVRRAAEESIASKELDRLIEEQAYEMRWGRNRADMGANLDFVYYLGASAWEIRQGTAEFVHRRRRRSHWRQPRHGLRTRNLPPSRVRTRLLEPQVIR